MIFRTFDRHTSHRMSHLPFLSLAMIGAGFIVITCSAWTSRLHAQDALKESECRWADIAPVIDGDASDAVWQTAALIDNFGLPWLKKDVRPPKTTTRARLLWDLEHLYFLAEMQDGDLFADVSEHDGPTWHNDVFELFFKPAQTKTGYYEFQVNAAGTKLDVLFPKRDPTSFELAKKDGDFHITSAVKLTGTLNQRGDRDQGWVVEGKIPWTDFIRTGGRPDLNEVWRFALCRYDYDNSFEEPDLSTSAPLKSLPHADFHHYEDYAPIKFVGPATTSVLKPRAIEKRVAVTTSRVQGSPEPPAPYRSVRLYPKLKTVFPMFVVHQPGSDRLIVITQDAPYSNTTIRRMQDTAETTEYEELLTNGRVAYHVEFHPKFVDNGYVYIGDNGPGGPEKDSKKTTRVTRYTIDRKPPYQFDPKSAQTIIEWPSDGHNGGALAFGNDGMMYVTSGDGTSDSDTDLAGQDMTRLTAKVLRIDVDHPTEGRQYSIPADNPFLSTPEVRPETWAYGMRNPWRMTYDRATGQLWVGNNGQDLWEQAYLIGKGANYGWSVMEGGHPFYVNRKVGPTPPIKPTVEHPHSEARSLTGGIVYRGTRLPELVGAYIYGDHSTGKIWGVKHDGKQILWHRELVDTPFHITGFGTDTRGELLICDHQPGNDGAFHTLEPSPPDVPKGNFPTRLSESGLFLSVAGHSMQPGVIPYSVNSPLWSDGAGKLRFVVLPDSDSKIDFSLTKPWGFPDNTVLVKTFTLNLEEGNPQSRRFIETRFMVKQQGEWVGYSYLWNDEQTDATLVSKEGVDRTYTIRTKDGVREQLWHYPSRAECMVCHSRAAGFVLGLNTPQMNREHDYGHTIENQLEVFSRLGLFMPMNWGDEAKRVLRERFKKENLKESEIDQKMAKATPSGDQRRPVSTSLLAFSPAAYDRLANPYDATQELEKRARSYLHVNCAVCHVEAGGGNSQFNLEFATERDKMKLMDVTPLHDKFGIEDGKLVASGDPNRSILLRRVAMRGRGQMPQLATTLVDVAAVQMLREWIEKMPARN